jgi:hypothetical protein
MLKENENTTAFDIARKKVLPKVWESLTEGTAVRKRKELLEVWITRRACLDTRCTSDS